MAELLSAEWVADLDAAARAGTAPAGVQVVIQQVVLDEDGDDELAYAIRIADGAISVELGRVEDADVTFTQDRATARAIATGDESAQAAFIAGRLRVGGDLRSVMDRAGALATLTDVFAPARAPGSRSERGA